MTLFIISGCPLARNAAGVQEATVQAVARPTARRPSWGEWHGDETHAAQLGHQGPTPNQQDVANHRPTRRLKTQTFFSHQKNREGVLRQSYSYSDAEC